MFDDFDDNEPNGDEFYNNTDIEETLVKFQKLDQDQSVFFSEEEIEALSYHFFINNQYKEQMKILEHGLYLYPGKVDFLIEKASVLSIDNLYQEALECVLQAKNAEPYNALIHKIEGEILCDLDKPEEAEVCFKMALEYSEFEDDEFVIDVYINYAQMLSQDSRLDKANYVIEKALKQFPENEILFNQLSMNFIAGNRYDKAIEYFKNHIDLNPYAHFAWYHLGRFYELTNQKKQALQAYEYSGLASVESKNAFFSLGSLHENNGDYNAAIENYLLSIKGVGDLYPYICLARCYLGLEKGELARSYLKKAKALDDLLPEHHYLTGYSYLIDKEALKALPYFKKVYKDDKNDFSAVKGIITSYSELDRFKDIEDMYNEIKKNNHELIIDNWKEFASVLYLSEMDEVLDDLLIEIRSLPQFQEELNCVLNAIKFDQEPSNDNKEKILSGLIHNFDDTLETVKLFCHELYEDDIEFKQLIATYQNDTEDE